MTCALCLLDAPLRRSHILPKFTFRWLKKTGGTDYLRFGATPNQRVQDGLWHRLLCGACEEKLSISEKTFKESYFDPITNDEIPRGNYGPWMLRFAVSVVWRVGMSQKIRGIHTKLPEDEIKNIDRVLENWRRYLVGEIMHPGANEVHLSPIGYMSEYEVAPSGARVPENWNRYIARVVEYDYVQSESSKFRALYAKLGPIAFFGIVTNEMQSWKGTRLAANEGPYNPKKMVLHPMVIDHFIERARSVTARMASISETQQELSQQEILKNIERFRGSGQFEAMRKDAERFGVESILTKKTN